MVMRDDAREALARFAEETGGRFEGHGVDLEVGDWPLRIETTMVGFVVFGVGDERAPRWRATVRYRATHPFRFRVIKRPDGRFNRWRNFWTRIRGRISGIDPEVWASGNDAEGFRRLLDDDEYRARLKTLLHSTSVFESRDRHMGEHGFEELRLTEEASYEHERLPQIAELCESTLNRLREIGIALGPP